MVWLVLQYFIFVFLACCGVLQLVARWNKLAGLVFFQSKAATYVFATLTIGGGYVWFFVSGDRNTLVPRMEGAQQTASFFPGALLALLFTAAISALVHRRGIARSNPHRSEPGLDALKKMNYFEALKHSFRSGVRKGRG